MFRYFLIVTSLLLLAATVHSAEVRVTVSAPSIVFRAAPSVVVVEKDIAVIPEFDHEVFVVSGSYWTFWGGHWYLLPKWNGHWVKVKPARVPARLVGFPRGKFLRYKHHPVKAGGVHGKKKKHHRGKHPGKGHGRKK